MTDAHAPFPAISTPSGAFRLLGITASFTALLAGCAARQPDASNAPNTIDPAPALSSAMTPPGTPPENTTPPVNIPPLPIETIPQAHRDATTLTKAMKQDVKGFTTYSPTTRNRFLKLAHEQIQQANTIIDRPQLLMVVDRNPRVQSLCFILAFPGDIPWETLGGTRVSTGQSGRKFYYITPTGVFLNTTDRLGYRAEGTKNENGIRGIGAKGSRVWDMGWQWAEKGWLPSREKGQIRLEIHATDPQFLEWRLGHTASEGCVRIPATLNKFMDTHGLLDVLYEQAASYDIRFRALLPKNRTPSPIAGDALVVIDSTDAAPQQTAAHTTTTHI